MNTTNEQELREQLAAIEHERWADWQKYCHRVLRDNNPSPEQGDILERWDRQIETPYADLTELEKQSDREQVDRYWHLIQAHTNAEIARTLDSLEAEFDRHAKSIGLWGMEGLMLDTLARTGNLSSEQKVERDAMVTERRALAILYGAIQAERAKLEEGK